MRSYGRIGTPLLVLALAGGCYNNDLWESLRESASASDSLSSDSDDSDGMTGISTVTGNSGADTSGGDTSGGGSGTDSGGSTGSVGSGDGQPVVEFTVDHESEYLVVPQADLLLLEAEVEDDDQDVVRVDFFWDGELLGSDDEAPYSMTFTIDSDEYNGEHNAYALAYDAEDHTSDESNTVKVDIQLPISGSQIWQALEDDSFASKAHGIASDGKGNIYVVGQTAVSQDDDGATRITIRKYADGAGALWTRHIPQSGNDVPLGFSVGRGVAIDSTGIIYVIGELDPEDDGGHLWIGKFSSEGLLIAEYTESIAFTRGRAIVIDPTDDNKIFVVGYSEKLSSDAGFIAAFDSKLQSLWSRVIGGESIDNNRLLGLAMDSQGQLVAAGVFREGINKRRGLIVKYSPKGDLGWWRAANSPPDAKDTAFSVAITADDEIIGIGQRKDDDFEEALWTFRLNSSGNDFESFVDTNALCGIDGCSVTIDASGNHVFAGALWVVKGADALLRKLSPGWLDELWSESLDGFDGSQDRSLAVTIDGDGFVYGAGFETKDMKPRWWVGKFNP